MRSCQYVTTGWCPSLSPSGPFWLHSTPCLPSHLGAGCGNELLTTAGQPAPHKPRPLLLSLELLLTHFHGNQAGICFFFSNVYAASHFPSTTAPSCLHLLCVWSSNRKAAGGNHMGRKRWECIPLSGAMLSLELCSPLLGLKALGENVYDLFGRKASTATNEFLIHRHAVILTHVQKCTSIQTESEDAILCLLGQAYIWFIICNLL